MAVFGVDCVQAVAPRAAIITSPRTDKNRRQANQNTLSLDCWAEDFTDAYLGVTGRGRFVGWMGTGGCHGRYSAHVLGVSLTLTAETSGQCGAHQS